VSNRAAADRRYDATRPAPVPVRLNPAELAWLDSQRQPGEGRGTALKRLAGFPNRAATE